MISFSCQNTTKCGFVQVARCAEKINVSRILKTQIEEQTRGSHPAPVCFSLFKFLDPKEKHWCGASHEETTYAWSYSVRWGRLVDRAAFAFAARTFHLGGQHLEAGQHAESGFLHLTAHVRITVIRYHTEMQQFISSLGLDNCTKVHFGRSLRRRV